VEYFIDHDHKNKIYNVASGKTIDLLTIANKINQIAEKPSEIIIKNPGFNTEYSADNSRLLEEIGGYNFTPFEYALKELYDWYKAHINEIDKEAVKRDEYIKYCRTRS
jgi:GDP-L-fucose synthase